MRQSSLELQRTGPHVVVQLKRSISPEQFCWQSSVRWQRILVHVKTQGVSSVVQPGQSSAEWQRILADVGPRGVTVAVSLKQSSTGWQQTLKHER